MDIITIAKVFGLTSSGIFAGTSAVVDVRWNNSILPPVDATLSG
jgi:hypothetical protein